MNRYLKINLYNVVTHFFYIYPTWNSIIEWIEESHNHIDDHNAIEEYAAPQ